MASGIIKFLNKKVCVQKAVYWGDPQSDGYGGYTFAPPIQIKCRWDDMVKTVKDDEGEVFISVAEVIVTQDLDVGGYLYLGDINDLTVINRTDPQTVEQAHIIQAFSKSPLFGSTDEFVRVFYLGGK